MLELNDAINSATIIWGVGWFVYALITAGACYWLAGEKGRDKVSWAMLGILLGIIAVIILGFSPPKSKPTTSDTPELAKAKRAAKEALLVECVNYNPKKLAEMKRILSGAKGDKEATELLRKIEKCIEFNASH